MLSRSCQYAVQAVVHLAKQPEGRYTLIRNISDELDIPHHYLGKIMQTLVKAGILSSLKGPKGGLTLAKKASELTLLDVVFAIDGSDFFSQCISGLSKCDDDHTCAIHAPWVEYRAGFMEMLSGQSLEELVKALD